MKVTRIEEDNTMFGDQGIDIYNLYPEYEHMFTNGCKAAMSSVAKNLIVEYNECEDKIPMICAKLGIKGIDQMVLNWKRKIAFVMCLGVRYSISDEALAVETIVDRLEEMHLRGALRGNLRMLLSWTLPKSNEIIVFSYPVVDSVWKDIYEKQNIFCNEGGIPCTLEELGVI